MILDSLDKDRLIAVGVSGGADSLALLHLLHEAGHRLLVCHFNHRLRPEADGEAAFVASIAGKLGLPFESGSEDVGVFALANHLSTEEAARKLRYRFLFERAREHAAQAVAVGHTSDDQVETVLMHFVRGAGLSGLKGMLPRTILAEFDREIPLVRPILDLGRADTEAYCREHALDFLTDPTNADPAYFRNRLRLSLVPELETYNAGFKAALLRSSQALQGDYELLNGLLDTAWARTIIAQGDGFVCFDRTALEGLPVPLRRGLIRRAVFSLRPGLRDVDFDALEHAAALPPTSVDIAAGMRLFSEAEQVYLAAPGADLPTGDWPQLLGELGQVWEWDQKGRIDLANGMVIKGEVREIPGELVTVYRGFRIGAPGGYVEDMIPGDDDFVAEPGNSAWLMADKMGDRVQIRAPRPGDRIEPKGMPGKTVKLSDLFINNKIPKRLRARWPVVWAGEQIAWVPGLRQSQRFQPAGESLPVRVWMIVVKRERKRRK